MRNRTHKVQLFSCRPALVALFALLPLSGWAVSQPGDSPGEESVNSKARNVIEAAIEAMGGKSYRGVTSVHSSGRYFQFSKGRKGFARFWDWTAFEPVKSRFQLGEGKRQLVRIFNLELDKGWTLEGESTVEEVPEESVKDFERSAKTELDLLMRWRLDEEGMNLYYYGPDDIAGQGEYEAVEFLDALNTSVVVFFDRESHLPLKLETHFTDKMGVRHKEERESSNWHEIQGIKTPLRQDRYIDGEIVSQTFLEEIAFNPEIPPEYFLEPVIAEKK